MGPSLQSPPEVGLFLEFQGKKQEVDFEFSILVPSRIVGPGCFRNKANN